MKLNSSNLTTQLYMWFYGISESKLPKNLCPYFWKTVFMTIMIIPYVTVCAPVVLFELILKLLKRDDGKFSTSERFWISIAFYVVVLCGSAMVTAITLFWTSYGKSQPILLQLSMLGIMLWAITILLGGYALIKACFEALAEYKRNKRYNRVLSGQESYEPKVNIMVEFVKAKYNKYCPTIEWTTSNNSETNGNND